MPVTLRRLNEKQRQSARICDLNAAEEKRVLVDVRGHVTVQRLEQPSDPELLTLVEGECRAVVSCQMR